MTTRQASGDEDATRNVDAIEVRADEGTDIWRAIKTTLFEELAPLAWRPTPAERVHPLAFATLSHDRGT
jgi:hypothetical protein